jgi:hypothetical protein
MSKFDMYNTLKDILSKNGAIPNTEKQYESVMNDLMFLIDILVIAKMK